jgi:signal transduction histidine kinase
MYARRDLALGRATLVGVGVALAAVLVGALAFSGAARVAADAQGGSLAARAATTAAAVEGLPPAVAQRTARASGATIRADAPSGAPPPPAALRIAPPSGPGWSVRGGAVQAEAPLEDGRLLVTRQALPAWVAPGPIAWALGAAAAVLVGVLAGLVAGRRAGRRRRLEHEREGRAEATERDLARARAAAEAGVEALGAALAPLRQGVAARTGAGRVARNDAMERVRGRLPETDRWRLDEAVAAALAASGPVARSLDTSDGRHIEIEAWAIPGGRLASVDDRLEERRLADLRRAISGAAAARLGAPLAEARSAAGRALVSAPKPAADDAARALAAIDRAEQLVAAMVRGGDADPRARRQAPARVGVAGVLWALAREWDRRLEPRHVRIEVDVDPATPPAHVDPRALEEILGELMRNAAGFTPRGGTISLSARPAGDRIRVELRDSGPGIDPAELGRVAEPYVRGAAAAVRPGAGLGLATATALAARSGGRLLLAPGPGGRVAVELPSAPGEVPAGGEEPGVAAATGPSDTGEERPRTEARPP